MNTKILPIEVKSGTKGSMQSLRSSRSVTSNLAEAWAKKIYIKHFVSKLSDSLGEEVIKQ
ncbi:MAG: four helix bundle protein [Draconibacterium sp.]|nr:four helix bundle protein [Draconibacterium sp.]